MGANHKMYKYVSKGAGDAQEFIKAMSEEQFQSYSMIICCSGDGTVHEVINGFYNRPSPGPKRPQLRIATLPAGSACCLSLNALGQRNIRMSTMAALYLILRPKLKELTVYKYKLQPGNRTGTTCLLSVQLPRGASRLPSRRRLQ